MLGNAELKELDDGWMIILIIWGAMLGSLAIFMVICHQIQDQIKVNLGIDFPFEAIKYTLYSFSILILTSIFYLRKAMLKVHTTSYNPKRPLSSVSKNQNVAVAKYLSSITIAMALSESIGIFGLVIFLLKKDWESFYLLFSVSAGAMVYFRPRKEELLNLAKRMKVMETGKGSY